MSSKRDGTGRFRADGGSRASMTRTGIDLRVEAQRLYRAAETRGDFTGAASVLRLMRDLSTKDDAARPDPGLNVNDLTEEEFEELSALLDPLKEFKTRVRQRLGLEPAPTPHVVSPTDALVTAPEAEPVRPFLYEGEIIRDGHVIEIDPETGEETPVGSVEQVLAEAGEEDDDARS